MFTIKLGVFDTTHWTFGVSINTYDILILANNIIIQANILFIK